MIAYLKGTLVSSSPDSVTIDVHGMGYRVMIPSSHHGQLPQEGEAVQLHTSFIIRENSQTLFGFVTQEEREIFEVLLTISGVGPKSALAIIGHLGLAELQNAVANHDIPTICRVPGIGKKSAERLLLEIRDKLPQQFAPPPQGAVKGAAAKEQQLIRDAMSALVNLGYNQMAAKKALQEISKEELEGVELGQLITQALQHI